MTEDISIRLAEPYENQLLSELAFRSKGYWGYSPEFMEACRAELSMSEADISSPHIRYFLAELEGKIVGYYAVECLSTDEYELEALFVEPEHIGQDIGRKLIDHAKSYARSYGAQSLLIQGDPNAAKFYRAAGGIQVGERESDSIPDRYLPEFRIFLKTEDTA
ncbi:MAG: GNAT family N-acetyltransferase [Leptolyngbya sp. SIO1D8]|nr:GNAT family N-acetyltransferase [Leptolyngbya sp. SIO1D8]